MLSQTLIYYWQEIFLLILVSDSEASEDSEALFVDWIKQ